MTAVIRPASVGDARGLAALAERTFRDTYADQNRPDDVERYVTGHFGSSLQAAELGNESLTTLVAEVDGRVAGYAQLAQRDGPPCIAGRGGIEVARFYVDRLWHGRGVAHQLMAAVADAARVSGARTLWLGVWEHNPRAIAFYRKCGFEDVGTQVFVLGADHQRDLVLARPLGWARAAALRGAFMPEPRLDLLIWNLQPPPRRRNWHGGPTPLGAVRGVSADQAAWRPTPRRKSIWEMTLHIAYWKYTVRRHLQQIDQPRFPRRPSNFPAQPDPADEAAWSADVALLRREHLGLLEAVSALSDRRLDAVPPTGKRWTYGELVLGIAAHDAYHTGQVQLLKRLWEERAALRAGPA